MTVGLIAPGVHAESGIGNPRLVFGEQPSSAAFSFNGVDAVGCTPAGHEGAGALASAAGVAHKKTTRIAAQR